jgi:hypothetical protein
MAAIHADFDLQREHEQGKSAVIPSGAIQERMISAFHGTLKQVTPPARGPHRID